MKSTWHPTVREKGKELWVPPSLSYPRANYSPIGFLDVPHIVEGRAAEGHDPQYCVMEVNPLIYVLLPSSKQPFGNCE
jgi:hypothetical protein